MNKSEKSDEYRYAKIYDPLLYPFIRRIRKKILSIVNRHQYSKILDVCCGTGDQLKLLKKHGFKGEGIDLSEAMLNIALNGRTRADCKNQDATEMYYGDSCFDLSMVVFALHEKNIDDAQKILDEMVRVTKPDGHIMIVDYAITQHTGAASKALIFLIEKIAGGDHYRHFRKYLHAGALPFLLSDLNLAETERYYFGQQGIVLLLLKKSISKENY